MNRLLSLLICLALFGSVAAQFQLNGVVIDPKLLEGLEDTPRDDSPDDSEDSPDDSPDSPDDPPVDPCPTARTVCCFDSVCCGEGTVWDAGAGACVLNPELAAASNAFLANPCVRPVVTLDYVGQCFIPACEGPACCGEGTEKVPDPTRLDNSCVCRAKACDF